MSIRASAGLKTALVSDGVGVHLVSLKRYCWMMLVLVFTGVCAAPQSKQTAPCLLNLSQVTQICTQMLKKHTALLLSQSLPTFAELFFLIRALFPYQHKSAKCVWLKRWKRFQTFQITQKNNVTLIKLFKRTRTKLFKKEMLTQNRTIYCPTDGEVLNPIGVIWNRFVK